MMWTYIITIRLQNKHIFIYCEMDYLFEDQLKKSDCLMCAAAYARMQEMVKNYSQITYDHIISNLYRLQETWENLINGMRRENNE